MNPSFSEMIALAIALTAILMVGSTHLRLNIWMLAGQTTLLAALTALYAWLRQDQHLFLVAGALFLLKAMAVPRFLVFIIDQVHVQRDAGTMIPTPIAMHLSIGFLGIGYILACQLPIPHADGLGWPSATASISLVCTGLLLMLIRRIALSQIIGFLVMENGIYIFGLTQTSGMPLLIEMGVLLDVLAGVMIAGLLAFRIKKNFEHIDVTRLAELKE
jgi:hydrogenase-4 component E